jgi:predicted GIY-YIG superfamily endonuclease
MAGCYEQKEQNMVIDDCKFTFSQLASDILPNHMERMRTAMLNPYPMTLFGTQGLGPRGILYHLSLLEDFTGCYVLIEKTFPIYVGISRSVIQRLIQHLKGQTHYDASLAYRIASENKAHGLQRKAAMKDSEFKNEFDRAKDYLKSMHVAFIEIKNDLELYLFEVYCAMDLKTVNWNTFRTH